MNSFRPITARPLSGEAGKIKVAVVGCGPAGLMAATVLSEAGFAVEMFESKQAIGLKFLLAGRGGLNLTRAEPLPAFAAHYGDNAARFRELLTAFSPDNLRAWLRNLGVETFVGSSGRIFPVKAEARDILKRWSEWLGRQGTVFHLRHRWLGFAESGALLLQTDTGENEAFPAAGVILALGGASWPQTGSDGRWTTILTEAGIRCEPFRPANCGLEVEWSEHFRSRFQGRVLKNVRLQIAGQQAGGDVLITGYGVEGGPVYALSAKVRDLLEKNGAATLFIDLKPDLSQEQINQRLARRRNESASNFLRKAINLAGPVYPLLREVLLPEELQSQESLAARLKNLPLEVRATRPLAEAISSAGGLTFAELNDELMLNKMPGVFVAGEMLDWEAPTGGYLLQGAFTTGCIAGRGLLAWLAKDKRRECAAVSK